MKNQTGKAKTDAHHKEVAETLIKMIEEGTAPWQKPWDGNASALANNMPFNGASKRRYRGINSLYLYSVSHFKGYKDPRWFTYKQVEELGGNVKRGEKSVKVEYWKFTTTIKNDKDGNPLPKEDWIEVDRKVPLIMRSSVFNAEQCENIPELELPKRDWEPVERAETIINAAGVPIFHDAVDMNYYSHGKDEIHLTPRESYKTLEAYYGTALHELGHSTGHEKRLNRTFGKVFGDENYAREELRAEIASFMLCNDLGISRDGSDAQHAAYVGSWIKALKEDPNEIFRASADAEAICNFLYDREREYVKSLENGQAVDHRDIDVKYPEIEPQVSQVAEQVAGYALPNISQLTNEAETLRKIGLEVSEKDFPVEVFYSTNYGDERNLMNVYVIDDKVYLGKADNVVIHNEKDVLGRDVTRRYYDNSDSSLVHLSDKREVARFISERSLGFSQNGMSDLGKFSNDDYYDVLRIEAKLLKDYPLRYDVGIVVNGDDVNVRSAIISNFEKDGKQYDVFLKDDVVYMGLRDRYDNRGVYDNADYSLIRVSENQKMFHLLSGTGYVNSQEAMIAQGDFSERDFVEYAELKKGILKDFTQVREIEFAGVPFKSPLVEDGVGQDMETKKYIEGQPFATNYVEEGERLRTCIIEGKAFLGYAKNFKVELGKDDVGNDVAHRYYDNSDNSLVHLSDKAEMAQFIAERSHNFYQDIMADLGKLTLQDAMEAQRLESTVLAGYGNYIEVAPGIDDNRIVIDGFKPSVFSRNGEAVDVLLKNNQVYLGESSRYDKYERIYDNSDYSLVKVSNNIQMYHLMNGLSDGLSREELVASGAFSPKDFAEYDEMRERILAQFDELPANEIAAAELDGANVEAGAREIGDNPFAGMTEVAEYVDTNFEKDGRRIAMVNVNGELHKGYSDNCKFDVQMGDAPQNNKVVFYYDNSDNSLEYLSDKTKMAHFISGMSYGRTQDEMLSVPSSGKLEAAFSKLDYEQYEFTKKIDFVDFKLINPVEAREDDFKVSVHSAGSIKYVDVSGNQLAMFEKQGSYFIGKEDNFDKETGRYDNGDYSLFKVTNNVNLKNLIVNEELDAKDAIEKGSMTSADIDEYGLFRERTNFLFRHYGSNMVHNRRMMLSSPDYEAKYPSLGEASIVPSNIEDVVLISSINNNIALNGGTYIGKRENMLHIYNPVNYGDMVYDNRDGSLVKLSDNPKIAELISDRSFGYNKDTIIEISEGDFTDKDFNEYNKIYDEHLSKLKFGNEYEDMGKFDMKEAMKMADEQVQAPAVEEKTFNPPSDAQLALAETLHCKYKEGVSREELSKIIAKRKDAIKKYNDAISQPAKEEQVESLKQAGVEIKEGLTIGEASKILAALPATVQTKVFMDRLKLEYAPEITRGEAAKLIDAKLKEFEREEKQPATEKTIEYMKKRGIEVPENVTRGEANKLIYNSPATAKQMAFVTNHKIECDKENLTYGKAKILVDVRLKELAERAKQPATEKMIARLKKEKVEFKEGITFGEASKIIRGIELAKLQVSDKQIKYANDLGIEIPEGAGRSEVSKLIGTAVRNNRIAAFEVPKDRKLTLAEGYQKLAKAYIEKGKPIDDKKIAGKLLIEGHRDCDVKQIIAKNSPNFVNDLTNAQSLVNEAKKLPSVKKAMEKERSR